MSPRKQGYFFVLVTMCIWGGFTLFARLNAPWHISAWDIAALRFAIAFLILMPILIYKKDLAFLWSKHAVILALIGGVIYCLTVYTAFLYAPAAHAAIFLNGCIPICTAIAAYILFRQPFDKHTWVSLAIMITALALMSVLMLQGNASAFGMGDLLLFISGAFSLYYLNSGNFPHGTLWRVLRFGLQLSIYPSMLYSYLNTSWKSVLFI